MTTFEKFRKELKIVEVSTTNYNQETFEKLQKVYGKKFDLLSIGFQKYYYDSYEIIKKYPKELQKITQSFEKKELKKINLECKNLIKSIPSIEDKNYRKNKYEIDLLDQLANRISAALERLNSLDENQRNLILENYKKYQKGPGLWDLFLSKFSTSRRDKVECIENLRFNYNQALFSKEGDLGWIKERAEELILKKSYSSISKNLEVDYKVDKLEEQKNQFKNSVYEIKGFTDQEKELFIKDALEKNKGDRFIVEFSLMQEPLKKTIIKKTLKWIKVRNLKQFNKEYPPKKLKRTTSLPSISLNRKDEINNLRRSSSLSL